MFVAKDVADNIPSSKLNPQKVHHKKWFTVRRLFETPALRFFVAFSFSIRNLFTHPTVQSHLCFLFEIFQLILWHRIGLAGDASTLRGMWIWTWQRFNIRLDLGTAMEAGVYTCNISNEYAIYYVLQYVFICRGGHGGMTYTLKTKKHLQDSDVMMSERHNQARDIYRKTVKYVLTIYTPERKKHGTHKWRFGRSITFSKSDYQVPC